MTITIATWNINSVRLRMPLVAKFLQEYQPDVLCLQEIKCRTEEFPAKDFRKLGYTHMAVHGQKGYHGVAIVSKIPLHSHVNHDFASLGDSRHQSVIVEIPNHPIELHNFYIPAGGDIPDVEQNPKFRQKLDFLAEAQSWVRGRAWDHKAMFVGDLNIAPYEFDVWSHKALLDVVSHTPVECEALLALLNAGNFVDVMRHFYPEPERLYTWWSYRAQDWLASNRGRRLDHIWATPALAAHTRSLNILPDVRGWERPSDHVPVIVGLEI